MRDTADNVIIVCSIENFDAMGVHTGDSITVAPQMTLSDRQYQAMRDEAKAVIRKVGVDTGGSNIQFAVDPKTGRRVVIEMNPRVSRSSALASKATGFPIAKIAALLAVGYHLDEIPNDITKKTPASLRALARLRRRQDPALDVREVPARRQPRLTIQMKSVGEAMAIGRTFPEALGKAIRSLEIGRDGLDDGRGALPPRGAPREARGAHGRAALPPAPGVPRRDDRRGGRRAHTRIDPWFLDGVRRMVEAEEALRGAQRRGRVARGAARRQAPRALGPRARPQAWACDEAAVRGAPAASSASSPSTRRSTPARPSSRRETPYFYSTYEDENESLRTDRPQGRRSSAAGPNRIGQGIEFDYCCVHACYALSEAGFETDHDQLQPRDGLDGLRHLGPPLLRAADLRGRLGRARQRAARRRPRPVRRADAAEARARRSRRRDTRSGGPRPSRSTSPRTAAGSGGSSASSASRRRRTPRRAPSTEALEAAPPHRLPARRAPLLRPRRPRDGGRLRRGAPRLATCERRRRELAASTPS